MTSVNFQLSGTEHVFKELLKMTHKGSNITSRTSYSTRGCNKPISGDLSTLVLYSFSEISILDISKSAIVWTNGTANTPKTDVSCIVKTDEKNL